MIVFNTSANAKHYVKHKKAQITKRERHAYHNSEEFEYYTINNKHVLRIWGWRCGCGCDKGNTSATIIGKIKSIQK